MLYIYVIYINKIKTNIHSKIINDDMIYILYKLN